MADADSRPSEPQPSESEGAESGPPGSATASPEAAERRRPLRRSALLGGIALLLAAAVAGTMLYLRHAALYESTDDAFIAAHVSRIAPRVAGVVERVFVRDNQLVQRGEPLFELDAADYELEVARARSAVASATAGQSQAKAAIAVARANVLQAKAKLDAAQAEAKLAALDLERTRKLHASGAQPLQALDRARSAADAGADAVSAARQQLAAANASVALSESNIEAAEATSHQAQIALQNAQLRRSYARVVAPIDGRVSSSNVVAGDYLQVGQQVMSLVDLRVWVTANFKETQLVDMRPGQPVEIEVDAYARSWHGRVDSFQQGTGAHFSLLPAENATGNYVKVVARIPVKIVFDPLPDPHRYLLAPGMSVVPRVRVTSRDDAPMVPGPQAPAPLPLAQDPDASAEPPAAAAVPHALSR